MIAGAAPSTAASRPSITSTSAFNSLDAQREACEAYIKSQAQEGWRLISDHYNDGGLSGASLERPALQKLLAEVRARKVDIVVVYKVDRLTRSLADFAKLIELFDAHLFRVGDAGVLYQLQHGSAHTQRAVVLCAVRTGADRGAGARHTTAATTTTTTTTTTTRRLTPISASSV